LETKTKAIAPGTGRRLYRDYDELVAPATTRATPPWAQRPSLLARAFTGLRVHEKLRLCGILSIGAGILPTLFLLLHLDSSPGAAVERSTLASALCWTVVAQSAGLFATAFLAWRIFRNAGGSLQRLGELVRAITPGNTATRMDLCGRNDESGGLEGALQGMMDAARADRETLVKNNAALILANEQLGKANQELETANARVRQLAEEAGTANLAKRAFLAVMSHEIRTPVNGIIGMTELAMKTPLNPNQRDCLEVINNSAQGLLELLSEVLDFSKIEAGKLELEVVDFNLRQVVEDAVATLAARHHAKGLELILDIHPDVPDALLGDPLRLRQILLNLISNANRFTQEGEVLVAVHVEECGEEETRLHFAVTDTGCGIPEEKQKTIFEAFTQGDSSTTRRFGGSGLGLAICSQLVRLMGGAIRVASAPGRGSCFEFTANFGLGAASSAAGSSPSDGRRALVVESHPRVAGLLAGFLAARKIEAVIARNGAIALPILEQSASDGRPFDFVIADTLRPAAGGMDVARRAAELAPAKSRIILLVSAGRAGDDLAQFPAGATLLAKPVRGCKLHEILDAALLPGGQLLQPQLPDGKGSSAHGRALRVLIAEDNATNRRIVRTHLEAWGHSVVAATDGTEAVTLFARERFDLVLMDLQMPRMDGIAATACIRQGEKPGTRVPILALTANVLKGVREECHAAGMDGYLGKPIREHELLAAIENVVPGLRAASDLQAGAPILFTPASAPAGVPFDVDALLRSVNGSRATLAGLLQDCLDDDAPGLFAQVFAALAENDPRKLQRAAHALKGVLGVFHAPAAFSAARRLEESARMGRTEQFAGQTEELCCAVSELLSSLERFLAEAEPSHRAA
jgi:signal transduction histidine kinase/CheY-like chemotaxis protein/HPt (histidine-containing phosphotransfer) domain-containing protein